MQELFDSMTNCIWAELKTKENINSYRRELQKTYINMLEQIIFTEFAFPNDAIILSRLSLSKTLKNIYAIVNDSSLDEYTQAHLENYITKIEAILSAMKIN